MTEKAGRNDPCPCGSGKKYKQCCLGKQQSRPLGQRKFTAKVLSSGANKAQDQAANQPEMAQAAIDYNMLMERSFGNAIHSTDEKPPVPENPDEYLPKEDNPNSHS